MSDERLRIVVLSCFVNSLWQIPVLLAAGSLMARALRRVGPEAEHCVWVGVLLLSLLLPLISMVPLTGFLARLGWSAASTDGHVTVLMSAGAAAGGFCCRTGCSQGRHWRLVRSVCGSLCVSCGGARA